MAAVVHYTQCPVCNSSQINPLLTVKDHTVSKESFVIWHCSNCTLRFTQDVPAEDAIAPYYNSPDYISHTNTNKGFINQLYKKVRKYTLQKKADLVIASTGIKKGKLLDVGCGTGAFLNVMQEKGWEAKGLEPEASARALALKLYDIEVNEPEQLFNWPDASFYAITLWHVLEHVHRLHDYISQLQKLLTKNGKLIIAVPNYTSADADIYRLNWAAYDVPRHLYHFTPKAMETLMQQHGLKIRSKKPMWFDAFYISLLSSKYKNGSTSYIGSAVAGIRSNITALINGDKCSSVVYIIEKLRVQN